MGNIPSLLIGPYISNTHFTSQFSAKYVSKSEGNSWTYKKAESLILESIQLSQSIEKEELKKIFFQESEIYPLGPAIALAYLSVLEECEYHCLAEGAEVKRLGGLHVIGTSLHESRRIDNQVIPFCNETQVLSSLLFL